MKRTSRSAEDADLEVLCFIYFFSLHNGDAVIYCHSMSLAYTQVLDTPTVPWYKAK